MLFSTKSDILHPVLHYVTLALPWRLQTPKVKNHGNDSDAACVYTSLGNDGILQNISTGLGAIQVLRNGIFLQIGPPPTPS